MLDKNIKADISNNMENRINQLISICQKYNVIDLYSFGSRSREVREYVRGASEDIRESSSDIDIGVRFRMGSRVSAETKVKMTIDLEDYFKFNRIDLVQLEIAPPFLALDIIRGELLYTNDPDDQAEYELYVMARAGDLMFFEKKRRDNILSVRDK